MSVTFQSICLMICCVVMAMFITPGQAEQGTDMLEQKQVRRASPWSMNSIGYNAGLQGLRKFFGKRANDLVGLDGELQGYTDVDIEIFNEFEQFLKLKESGLLGTNLLRCLLDRANDENEDKK